jgi:hypothetical protein
MVFSCRDLDGNHRISSMGPIGVEGSGDLYILMGEEVILIQRKAGRNPSRSSSRFSINFVMNTYSQTVRANGIRQHYLMAGDGFPVVLLNGFPKQVTHGVIRFPNLRGSTR